MKVIDTLYTHFSEDHQYIDNDAKINYMKKRFNFKKCAGSSHYLQKNDLVIPNRILFNYTLSELEIINFLADNYYVYNPFDAMYMGEYLMVKFEDVHSFTLKELEFMLQYAKETFHETVKIN
jgi:hypothetical protein